MSGSYFAEDKGSDNALSPAGQHDAMGQGSRDWMVPFRHSAASNGPSWIMSLADLCLLMLTFCVLVFSMSVPNTASWQSLIDGLSRRADMIVADPVRQTSPELAASALDAPPGDDLRYVQALLKQAIAEHPELLTIDHRQDGMGYHLILPQPFESVSLRLLAPILDRLPNRLAVQASVVLGGARDDQARQLWEQAMQSSVELANSLHQAGYTSQITPLVRMAYGQGGSGHGTATGTSVETIGIVLMPEAKE
jgi:chemotaxis protein MotB